MAKNPIVIPDVSGEISTGYVPRPFQKDLHASIKRFNVIVAHRRFGKSIFCLNHLIDRALRNNLPMPRYAYLGPTYAQIRRVIWDQLKMYTSKIPGVEYNEAELRADFPGNKARIMLLSGENYESLKGIYLDGVVLDEYASMSPQVWSEAIRPTLSDRMGWAVFIGTPRGRNNFYDLYQYAKTSGDPEWYAALYRASETKVIDEKELESARRTMTPEEYNQEYESDFTAALTGAYFGKELMEAETSGRVGKVPYDPSLLVDTAWDLGINDSTTIWFFQSMRGRHHIIDYLETTGLSMPEIVKKIQAKNYPIGVALLPHDAKARDLSTGKAMTQTLFDLGIRKQRVIPRIGAKVQSINAARMVFKTCYFDQEKCARGLEALAQYQRKFDSKTGVWSDAPLHNWASNGADAFQQFALGVRANSGHSLQEPSFEDERRYERAETEYDPFGRYVDE